MEKEFVKDKYYFSEENKLMFVRKIEEKLALKREINLYLEELQEFKINIKDLDKNCPNYITRNLLLNISYYFINEDRWMQKLYKSRELPIGNISRELGVSKITVEKWEKYLISYIILLAKDKYRSIVQCLNVKEVHELSTNKHVDDREVYKGLVLKNRKNNHYILTQDGRIIYITNKENSEVGDDASGVLKKKLKDYKKNILTAFIILIIIISGIIYAYNTVANNIIINSNIKIKLKVNNLGRVIYTHSETTSGNKLLESVDIEHKHIDESIKDILSYMKEKEIFINGNTSIIISGKKPIDSKNLKMSEEYIKENKLPVIINNNGIEYDLK